MNDLFALDLTINLLLLGVGAAMVAGNLTALFKNNSEDQKLYFSRTVFFNCLKRQYGRNFFSCSFHLSGQSIG